MKTSIRRAASRRLRIVLVAHPTILSGPNDRFAKNATGHRFLRLQNLASLAAEDRGFYAERGLVVETIFTRISADRREPRAVLSQVQRLTYSISKIRILV